MCRIKSSGRGLPGSMGVSLRGTAIVAAAVLLLVSGATVAGAQTPEQFYKGKSIELAIGYPPAGSNDFYARLLARHLGKHIPGNPSVVPPRVGTGSLGS